MTDVKHFILDVNVSVDHTSVLLEQSETGACYFWIAASQIPTLIYVAKRVFKRTGLEPKVATQAYEECYL